MVIDFQYHIFKEQIYSKSNLILKCFYTNNSLSVQKNNFKHETKITWILPSRYNHYWHSEVYFFVDTFLVATGSACIQKGWESEREKVVLNTYCHSFAWGRLWDKAVVKIYSEDNTEVKEKPCPALWGRLFQCPQSWWFAPFGENLASLATNKRKEIEIDNW